MHAAVLTSLSFPPRNSYAEHKCCIHYQRYGCNDGKSLNDEFDHLEVKVLLSSQK